MYSDDGKAHTVENFNYGKRAENIEIYSTSGRKTVMNADAFYKMMEENTGQNNSESEYEGEGEHSMYDENGNLKTK